MSTSKIRWIEIGGPLYDSIECSDAREFRETKLQTTTEWQITDRILRVVNAPPLLRGFCATEDHHMSEIAAFAPIAPYFEYN